MLQDECRKLSQWLATRPGARKLAKEAAMLIETECPPLPPTRTRHRGDKINPRGGVSALCFPKPRAIDMKRATWVMSDDAVTCPKCRALIDARGKTPNYM
jgi:hypothetical protein